MTLGRRGRDPEPRAIATSEAWQTVEVEELPAQRVPSRGPARPGSGALLAAGGLAVILVAGLGFLGGRGQGRAESAAAEPSPTRPPNAAKPYITPSIPCGPSQPGIVQGATLMAAGTQAPGAVEVIDWLGSVPSTVPSAPGVPTSTPIEIRADIFSVLYTVGDVCALAWQIALVDSDGSIAIETVENPKADPGFAQQNRFELPLWQYRGRDYELEALLTFPNAIVRATWPVRLLPFELPRPSLMAGSRPIAVEPGCDLQLSLGSGGREPVDPCDASVAAAPPVSTVNVGQPLTFGFSEGWGITPFAAACGQLTEVEFIPETDCEIPIEAIDQSARFAAADVAGTWTVGIAACATQQLSDTYNEVCGTWYATVRVQK